MTSRRSARLSKKASSAVNGHSLANAVTSKATTLRTTKRKTKKIVESSAAAVEGSGSTRTPRKRKAAVVKEEEQGTAIPSTTPKKRSAAPVSSSSAAAADVSPELVTPKAKKVRPANPKATNAPLQTPGGTRILKAYPSELLEQNGSQTSPSKGGAASTTTANILDQAVEHLLSVDPRLKPLTDKHHCTVLTPQALNEQVDPFNALCSSIMGQQVSGAAAAAIKRRFIALFEPDAPDAPADSGGIATTAAITAATMTPSATTASPAATTSTPAHAFFPSPAQVAATSHERLRTAGLSGRKAEYIQGLAQKFSTGELSTRLLVEATDDELLEKLIAVRGLGRWSVEMFAFFALKRLDIFSTGDLGVQRGVAAYVGRDVGKLKSKGGGDKWKYMKEAEMLEVANRFVPYRSLFMWYMWRIEDVNLTVLSG